MNEPHAINAAGRRGHPKDHGEVAAIHDHIDAHWESHLEAIKGFLRQPSISADGTGIPEMARKVAYRIRDVGGTAEIVATPGHPVVYGELSGKSRHTVLLYGMYDVQPVTGEQWDVDPFAAEIVERPPFGPCVVARGVANTKGPLAGMFNALESIQAVRDALPVNIKFIIEGEEELGSRHLSGVIAKYRDRLTADAAFFPFYRQDVFGKPVIHLGCKGVIFLELVARGGDRGGPVGDAVHGSRAVWFDNPAWWLVQALSTLLSRDQTRVLVEGFYDDISGPPPEDEALLATLAQTFDAGAQLTEFDVHQFKARLDGLPLLRTYLYEPTCNLDGITGGHAGAGDKSMIPHVASAKLDCRLVPGMRPDRVCAAIRRHLDAHGFDHLDLVVHDAYPAARVSVRAPIVRAMIATYRAFGYEPEIWPTIASSMPLYLFTQELGLEIISGGLGHGGRAHAANEYATVDGMRWFEKSFASLLYEVSDELVRESPASKDDHRTGATRSLRAKTSADPR